ncbi:NAD(P)-dependent dehydrogenase (short-subunit alcohol dehydrogenase family) [Rhizobium beringeri]
MKRLCIIDSDCTDSGLWCCVGNWGRDRVAVRGGVTAGLDADPESTVMQRIRQAPAGRMAKASGIANVALFLAGDEASFVHGSVYTADGGRLIR